MARAAASPRTKCVGYYKSGPRKGRIKAGYREAGPGKCPTKFKTRRHTASESGAIAKKAYKLGLKKGLLACSKNMEQKAKAIESSARSVAPASYSKQAAAFDRIYGRGMSGLGGNGKRRRRRRPR